MNQQISFSREVIRKLFHLFLLILPIGYHFLGKWRALAVVVPMTGLVLAADHYRNRNLTVKFWFEKFFKPILRSHELEGGKFCGATWVALATCSVFFIGSEEIVVAALAILAICDSAAAIVGRSFVSQPFFEKTRAGSIAFYISGLVVLFFCGAIYESGIWFYLFGFFALFCATIIEARPSFFNIDDNFTIPVSFAVIMMMFNIMWNYNY